jgi:hypothetical protein
VITHKEHNLHPKRVLRTRTPQFRQRGTEWIVQCTGLVPYLPLPDTIDIYIRRGVVFVNCKTIAISKGMVLNSSIYLFYRGIGTTLYRARVIGARFVSRIVSRLVSYDFFVCR